MLVLSRRKGEKIVFPNLGVTLEVLRVQGNTARLGIDAPRNIKVLRDEITAPPKASVAGDDQEERRLRHSLRNRLHTATLALHLFKRQLEAGMSGDAETTFDKILCEFQSLEQAAERLRRFQQAGDATPPAERPRRRTLLVEDDQNESELLAGLLRMSGFEVATAGDGEDALHYLASHECPDVMLLDMLMPRCDGLEMLTEIRKNPALDHMKVFAVSGSSADSLGVACGPSGVDRWFQKPVNPEQLVQIITRDLVESA